MAFLPRRSDHQQPTKLFGSVYRTFSLPPGEWQVLGADLNCSESTQRRPTRAGQNSLHVRFGSKADLTRCLSHVRFAPESGHGRFVTACPLSADIVAKVAAPPLWNSNLKQSNRDVRTFESMLRLRVKT
jgi:hypothetical protein